MKIAVIGPRNIYGVQGGIETHCKELYTRIVKFPEVERVSIVSIEYYGNDFLKWEEKINIRYVKSIRSKSLEKFVYSIKSIFETNKIKPDIVHVHGLAVSWIVPILKLNGFKVVSTLHSRDYLYPKWNRFAKLFLKYSEKGLFASDAVICVSKELHKYSQKKRKKQGNVFFIPNGITTFVEKENDYDNKILKRFGLKEKKYILSVGRITKEKGFDLLIKAYICLPSEIKKKYKLVIIGGPDSDFDYFNYILKLAKNCKNIVLTGFIPSERLPVFYRNAKLFVLPSYFEGLPIALLEAMSFNIDILISDIPAHKEFELEELDYFERGNVEDLRKKLYRKLIERVRHRDFKKILSFYGWDKIARETFDVYKLVLSTSIKQI